MRQRMIPAFSNNVRVHIPTGKAPVRKIERATAVDKRCGAWPSTAHASAAMTDINQRMRRCNFRGEFASDRFGVGWRREQKPFVGTKP